jgi:hypothetical protein
MCEALETWLRCYILNKYTNKIVYAEDLDFWNKEFVAHMLFDILTLVNDIIMYVEEICSIKFQ